MNIESIEKGKPTRLRREAMRIPVTTKNSTARWEMN